MPFIRDAKKMSKRKIKIFAAPWTAPEWMMGNNGTEGTNFLLPKYYQTWADYYVKWVPEVRNMAMWSSLKTNNLSRLSTVRFIKAYRMQHINVGSVSTQNEPSNGNIFVFPIPRVGWTPKQQRLWVAEYLGPTLEWNEKNVKIIGFDDQRLFLPDWVATVRLMKCSLVLQL